MKIQLVSDLHMEFAPIEITNAGADVLVLSGDIVVAKYLKTNGERAQSWRAWFERTCSQFNRVYYVLGNHEHYGCNFDDTYSVLQTALGHIPNLRILDNQTEFYEGVLFIGTTLWTDFDRGSLAAKGVVANGLNDYHVIKKGPTYRKLMPNDTIEYHNRALRMIDESSRGFSRVVVLGHHAPSWKSISPRFQSAGLLNFGYYSDLERFIEQHQNIALWTHGHVHNSADYMLGDVRIVANPRRYHKNGYDENGNFNPNLVIEV